MILPVLGKWESANAHAQLALRGAEKCLGGDHPDTAACEEAAKWIGMKVEEERRRVGERRKRMVTGQKRK